MQTKEVGEKKDGEPAVSVHATKRGNPYVNFEDGRAMDLGADAAASQPVALVSADFDSDGVADVITADASGALQLLKGIGPANFALDPTAKEQRRPEPFSAFATGASLGIAPDFLFAGDFNADGKQDVFAAVKGDSRIVFLRGDGSRHFSQAVDVAVRGRITSIESGEIGRPDGQADIAVAFTNKTGSFLAVFEHPEGAFTHKPDIIRLPSAASAIAIGNMDVDFYSDIAVACGSELTIVHGRGQAYPWDIDPKLGIKRPPPVVATRRMPFAISGMTIGRFGNKRGQTLALLGGDGNIYQLERNRREAPSNNKLPDDARKMAVSAPFIPSGAEPRNLASIAEPPMTPELAERYGIPMIDTSDVRSGSYAEILTKRQDEAVEKYKNTDKKELEKLMAAGIHKSAEFKERAKRAYLRSISGKPSTLGKWSVETLISGSQLANASASKSSRKMLRVNVSSSNLDDILLVDSIGNQIQIVTQTKAENQRPTTEVIDLETEGSPLAVLPMRLNIDALSDLVVLHQGASVPSVTMTAPAQNFIVTSNNETGDCLGANPCSLRNAILLANQSPGMDFIGFSFGGVTIIAPDSQLPVITDPVIIYSAPGVNGLPRIEITGVNITTAADGLKIRTSNTTIAGLTVNEFTGVFDGNGSLIGGNGITIESTTIFTNNANNWVFGNYLGTDVTGSLSKSNDGSGLNIFDADNNQIGGTGPSEGNVISGNGSLQTGGVGISMTAGNDNYFWGNILGLNSLGTGKIPNNSGFFFTGSNNLFGGDGAGMGNTVSGNGRSNSDPNICAGLGIDVRILINLDSGELLTLNNNLKGNRLGTNPAGTVGLGNCLQGMKTSPLTQTTVGSITQNGRNIISDNGYDAISCGEVVYGDNNPSEGGFCDISGNNIGTDVSGTIAIPNDQRNAVGGLMRLTGVVQIDNNLSLSNVGAPGGTTAGGACTGFCNLISGNMSGVPSSGALIREGYGIFGIFSNYIGTNQNGDQTLSNFGGVGDFGRLSETYIGKGVPGVPLGNVFAGETSNGFAAAITSGSSLFFNGENPSSTSYIEANLIGTDKTGTFALQPGAGSGTIGINVLNQFTTTTFIGAAEPSARNIISGHKISNGGGGNGISIVQSGGQTKIVNNLIGLNSSLNPLGNEGNGISVSGSGVVIGGTDQEINQIAWNGTTGNTFAGVLVSGNSYGSSIRNNSIHDNVGLGIDLTGGNNNQGDGVTANDCRDFDTGPNDLQNFPLLEAPVFNANGTFTVSGALLSLPVNDYTIDFYSNTSADSTGHGEGGSYVGSANVRTNGNGVAPISFTSSVVVPPGIAISATATDRFGSTSEFSCNAGATCSDSLSAKTKDYEALAVTCPLVDPIIVNIATDEVDDPVSLGQNVCDVDTVTPENQCSLRAAIQVAERRAGFDRIEFAIPGAGVHTISPVTFLPTIEDPVVIDATTQPGYNGLPLIELSGVSIVPDPNCSGCSGGLSLEANNSTIRGFAINRFYSQIGIGGDKNRVEACFIGLNPDGLSAPPLDSNPERQQRYGISLLGTNHTVGGAQPSDGNVISGNRDGVYWQIAGGIYINNNKIGTDRTGMAAIPNGTGIHEIGASQAPTLQNVIEKNLISGNSGENSNTGFGIFIDESTIPFIIRDNTIGGNANLSAALPNSGSGIFVKGNLFQEGLLLVTIRGNTIVGHNGSLTTTSRAAGINLTDGTNYTVVDNFIGVTPAGLKIPNANGIEIRAAGELHGALGPGNTISGNTLSGIRLKTFTDFSVTNAKITGNSIGVNAANDTNLGNDEHGISFEGAVLGAEIVDNIISGNGQAGISLPPEAINSEIHGNIIGTAANNGNPAIPNRTGIEMLSANNRVYENTISANIDAGIDIFHSSNNNVYNNTVSDNSKFGILLGNTTPDVFDKHQVGGRPSSSISPVDANLPVENNEIYRNRLERNGVGIAISEGANNNVIGSTVSLTLGLGNTICGNVEGVGYGIFMGNTSFVQGDLITKLPSGNQIVGNRIGENVAHEPSPNNVGIVIFQARNNFIGGVLPSSGVPIRNIVVANHEDGIRIGGNRTKGNQIAFNSIGVSDLFPDNSSFGNEANGIYVSDTSPNDIKNNIIGWNHANGISVFGLVLQQGDVNSLLISGNSIGTVNAAGIGNINAGIRLDEVQDALIGLSGDPKNIITGNGGDGILIEGGSSGRNVIVNSIIGTNESGAAKIGNGGNGIRIIGGRENTIGGVQSVGNIISGNVLNGVLVSNSTLNKIYGNRIGVINGADGNNRKLGNGLNGIKLFETSHTAIGDPVLNGYRNFIGGNQSGIVLQGGTTGFTLIKGNFIGTDTVDTNLGNVADGIFITEAAARNVVGGVAEVGSGNRIAYNGGDGVRANETAGCCNVIDPNTIYGNVGLGIDIGLPGVTPNDPGDGDTGANNLQNYPEITNFLINGSGDLVVSYKIDSLSSNSNYGVGGIYVEFFKADSGGEGKLFLGLDYYTILDHGPGPPGIKVVNLGNATALGYATGDRITSTATDADGNTSEFFPAAAPTAAGVSLSGRVLKADGRGITNARVVVTGNSLTQARNVVTSRSGAYSFDDLQAGETYIVTVRNRRYMFTTPSRVISLVDNVTDVDFVAEP
ncbi:MAG: right-handed parallel beta-helix repeat-containing protein [Chloracidobacterium sp.]|nr:right-handed parallel beta-helix repeat-containing protein [Chloracidobacterium sp.]